MSIKDHITILQPFAELNNPHIWTDSRSALSIRFSLYEALIRYDPKTGYLLGLADRWHTEDDGRTWTFHIRPGVCFHDGSLMTIEDVQASLRHAFSPHIPGAYGTDALLYSYLGQAEIIIKDRSTIQIVNPEPMADMLDILVNTVILPARVLTQTGVSEVVGSGTYRLLSTSAGEVTLDRNDHYWGDLPPVRQITFKAEPDPLKRVAVFCQGAADVITYIPPIHRRQIEQAIPGSYHELKIPLCVILIFNFRSPKCQDVRVRQALNYATNVDELIQKVMGGHAARLNGPLSPQHSGSNPDTPPYPYDPARAKQLLTEAGYPDGIELAFDVPTRSPDESLQLAEHLVEQYRQTGIILHPTVHHDRPAYAYMVKGKQFEDLCIFDSSPTSSYRVLREKINSKIAGPWWAGYSNPEVDRLMEQAWGTLDETERVRLYRQISAITHADAPWVFLYNPTDGYAIRPELSGWNLGIEGLVQ